MIIIVYLIILKGLLQALQSSRNLGRMLCGPFVKSLRDSGGTISIIQRHDSFFRSLVEDRVEYALRRYFYKKSR